MIKFLEYLGENCLSYFSSVGRATRILFFAIVKKPEPIEGFKRFVKQLYFVGFLSLIIIMLSGFFIGMVLGLQGYTVLVNFGAEQALGQLIALSLVRELGPVFSALLFAGRAGSALTAEISLMKTTEQLEAMEMMGVDPLHRIVNPRFWAGVVSLPLLSLIFSAIAIIGGYMVGVDWLDVDKGAFWSNMQTSVDFSSDVCNGIIKSVVFGIVITWISVYQGIDCVPTAEGIGRATTRTVVFSSLAVLGIDFFLTAIMFAGV